MSATHWRAATAKEQSVPAYVIFHDATLRQIATDEPGTLAELGRVSGVGENKLNKYGQQVLDVLAESLPAAPAALSPAVPAPAAAAPKPRPAADDDLWGDEELVEPDYDE